MNAEALTGLKGSIAKWKAIVAGTGEDNGQDNCPLCKLFFELDCIGCPVFERTHHKCCKGTPYHDFKRAWNCDEKEKAKRLAQAELDFLKSLLPEQSSGGLNAKPTSEATASFQ